MKIYGSLMCHIELSRLSCIPPPPPSQKLSASFSKGRNKLKSAYEVPIENSQKCFTTTSNGGQIRNDKRRQSESPLCKPLSDSKEYLSSSSECRDGKREKKRPSSSLDLKSNRSYTASPAKSFPSKLKSKTFIKTEYEENDLVNGLLPPPVVVAAKEETSEPIPKEYIKLDPMDSSMLKVEPSHNLHLQSNGALDSSSSNNVINKSLKRRRPSSSCNSPYEKEKKKNKRISKLEVRWNKIHFMY